ncbi:hypothetical protein AB1N83_010710 [Pleurotus pulmonarius]
MQQTDRVRSYGTTRIGIPFRDQYEANHDSEREIRPPIRCNERRRLLVRRCPLQSPGHRLADTKTTPSIACVPSTSWLPSAPPKFAQPPRKLWKLQTSPSIVNEEHGNRGARVVFDPYYQFSYVGVTPKTASKIGHARFEALLLTPSNSNSIRAPRYHDDMLACDV